MKKKNIVITVAIITLCVTTFYFRGYIPYWVKYQLKTEISVKQKIQKEKFQKEAERMKILAEKSHEKCPSYLMLLSNTYGGWKKIPAYPDLSAIYLHVLPPMHYSMGWTKKEKGYIPLTDIEPFRLLYDYRTGKKTLTMEEVKPQLDKLQKGYVTSAVKKEIEASLVYCGMKNDGVPLEVIVVDRPNHKNLEQEDALTIVAGGLLREQSSVPYIYRSSRDWEAGIYIQTSQYIPRWNVFPESFIRYNHGARKSIYGFIEKDNPYQFTEIYAKQRWIITPSSVSREAYIKRIQDDVPKKKAIRFPWPEYSATRDLTIRYDVIKLENIFEEKDLVK